MIGKHSGARGLLGAAALGAPWLLGCGQGPGDTGGHGGAGGHGGGTPSATSGSHATTGTLCNATNQGC